MDTLILPAATRQCVGSNRLGERCKRTPIPGGTVCVMHGGATPQVRQAAQRRLLGLVEPIIDFFEELYDRWNAQRCPTCGYPNGDPLPLIQVGRLVLDRSGFGPHASFTVEREPKTDDMRWVEWLRPEDVQEISQHTRRVNELKADARARMDMGHPPPVVPEPPSLTVAEVPLGPDEGEV